MLICFHGRGVQKRGHLHCLYLIGKAFRPANLAQLLPYGVIDIRVSFDFSGAYGDFHSSFHRQIIGLDRKGNEDQHFDVLAFIPSS
jgi:hypothetical protein